MKLSAKIICLALMTSFVAGHAFAAGNSGTSGTSGTQSPKKKDPKKDDRQPKK
jgi:hypothetical protein